MNTTKKEKAVKLTEEVWRDIFNKWSSSGLNDADFCKRENYSIDAFRYWRRRLDAPGERPTGPAKRSKFQVRSDASKQRWVRDDKKEAFWRQHIQGWKRSGLSKRAYCKSKNLSESSFNAWNREIELRERENVTPAHAEELLAGPVHQISANPFVALRVLPDSPTEEAKAPPIAVNDSANANIELLVPGGAVIRINADCSAVFIAQLFSALKA